ncbi:MAG: ImmA/IrrE family metallo-endopeptidase [Gemmatimonadota bacterium]
MTRFAEASRDHSDAASRQDKHEMSGRHPSVVALLETSVEYDAADAIRARARELVASARSLGWEGPPFSMLELASVRQLRVDEEADLKDDQDACVVPGRVLLNRRKSSARRRYSLAHEIVHTLFPDYEDGIRRVGTLWRRHGDDSEVEFLCQVGAAELLFPLEEFTASVVRFGLSLASTLTLATTFHASVEASARRIVETSETPAAGVLLRPFDPATNEWSRVLAGDEHDSYAELRVSSAWYSRFAPAQIPVRSRPPTNGSAIRAWKGAAMVRRRGKIHAVGAELWTAGDPADIWHSESITLPADGGLPREVLCLRFEKHLDSS